MKNKFKTENSRPLKYGEWLSYVAARALGIALLSGLVSASTDPLFAEERNPGAIVESLNNNFVAARAGLRVGDVIRNWSRGGAKGEIYSPFDVMEIETEQAPRGIVTLGGRRAGQERHWTMGFDDWGLQTRPVLAQGLLSIYSDGKTLEEGGRRLEASRCWRLAADQFRGETAPWFLYRAARSLADARQWAECDETYRDAIKIAVASGPSVLARLLRSWGNAFNLRGDWGNAEKYYQRWSVESCKFGVESFSLSDSLHSLGRIANQRGDLSKAEEYYARALAIRDKLAPGSLPVAASFHNLGNVFVLRGDVARAEAYYRRALRMREKLAPKSLEVAESLSGLGNVSAQRGDLDKAQLYFRGSLAIREKLAPESLALAKSLDNLGLVSWQRGDLDKAQEYEGQALTIRTKLASESLDEAASLNNVGLVFWKRGDLANAEEYYTRALRIREKLAPGSLDLAESLNNLGCVSDDRGDPARAETYLRRALKIWERLAPGRLFMAASLHRLGDIALKRGDLVKAEEYYRGALAIREKLAPGSANHAETLAALGQLMRQRPQLDSAAEFFAKATSALEHQTVHLGGTESERSRFRCTHASYYRNYVDILIAQNKPQLAFAVLERSRARSLLEMLAERDLVFAADLPSEIRLARLQNAASYDRIQAEIASLSTQNDAVQIEQRLNALQELERERDEITERVRRASPRLAELQHPQPLTLAATRKALDPGTVLLSFLVGPDHTVLFVVQSVGNNPGISVFTLPVRQQVLREYADTFRASLQDPKFRAQSRMLYDLLLRPAEQMLACSERILISPDGPLHSLPFGALLRNQNEYLVEWRPLHTIQSATLYAELNGRRRKRNTVPVELVAFGDPQYQKSVRARSERAPHLGLRSATVNGFTFTRLPFSRGEVNAIAALYPGHSQVFLGADAIEERAKSIGRTVRYVHFATHAVLDQRLPLNSSLALAIPENPRDGQDNGLLQTWEIFEQMRIDADLVTLSACQTGLGEEWEGEGLIGLTRAFLYAGAHSILASQWDIQDLSTAEFMKCFYRHLKNGAHKDEALRQAQLEFLRLPQFASPFYWAAFFLIGDPL